MKYMNTNIDLPPISIIIPTFNRPSYLERTLISLEKQTPSQIKFEAIVVDDGSEQSYFNIINRKWNFSIKYFRQENQGEAIARNLGAENSEGEFLLFLDDDMLVDPIYVFEMYAEHTLYPEAVLIGNMKTLSKPNSSIFNQIMTSTMVPKVFGVVPFTAILAGVLGISKKNYKRVGGMRPFPDRKRGGWIDMEFAYRADRQGHVFRVCEKAIAFHDDYVFESLENYCKRLFKVSELVISMFKVYPDLFEYMPMFQDKAPIFWGKDSIRLIVKKIFRPIMAWQPTLLALKWLSKLCEKYWPMPYPLKILYRWIGGSYIYLGFRKGMIENGIKDFRANNGTREKNNVV